MGLFQLYTWSIFTNRRMPRALRSCPLPFCPQYQLVIPLGQNCRPIGGSQCLFPPLHAGTLRCHSDALVHRSTGHQASLSPGKLGGLSQIPFFTSSAVYWFRPNPKGAGTARFELPSHASTTCSAKKGDLEPIICMSPAALMLS